MYTNSAEQRQSGCTANGKPVCPAVPDLPPVAAAAGGSEGGLGEEDAQPPQVLGDWRAFRAKLVAESGDGGWAARQAEDNRQLLQIQSPALAQEETWAHATGAPEVGGLLLATSVAPGMLGDEYWQVVVFLLQHGPQGSLGLILNRPTSLKMGRGRGGLPMSLDGMPELRDAFASSILYCGGYKAQHIVTLLHGQRRLEGAVEVIPGIYLGAHEAATAEVVTGGLLQTDFRFFAGCLAWEPGQLAREIAAGAWHTAACSRTLVLKQCLQLPVPLWREAMCLMGGRLMGWSLGLFFTVAVAAVETATLCVLCAYAEESQATSYSGLVHAKLGPGAGAALAPIMYIYLLLSCTAYLMIAADCLCPLLASAAGPEAWWAGRQAVVAAVGLGVALPLSLPRTLGAVAGVSNFKVYAIAFVVGAVLWRAMGAIGEPAYSWAAVHASTLDPSSPDCWRGLAVALPILAFGFQCHTAVVDLFLELEDEPSFFKPSSSSSSSSTGGRDRQPRSSSGGSSSGSNASSSSSSSASGAGSRMSPKLRGMMGVGVASLGAMAAFYGVMGVAGYLALPGGPDSNVMNGFPASDPLMQAARVMVGLIVIAAFPVNHVPARSTILEFVSHHLAPPAAAGADDSSSRRTSSSGGSGGSRGIGSGGGRSSGDGQQSELPAGVYTAETLLFCGVATAIALSVTDLGTMFQLVGGTAAAVLIFGIPGALLLKAATEGGSEGQGGGRRALLLAAGIALELITVTSWGVTLYNLTAQH
ncbi:transcriptional regulator [Chlorella sorokiniana]|uniref:Transcriptional regulator n=1 Tax=Chlorella sorokiniana TaxID=3076 RepID=A0A2P6TIY4_CHLSO|nr:transcriptional regulator [Chlorella sorokiniana]|eukprot:PRW39208.1 transcriptional regulator [Chlorella sorokiniana]